MVFNLVDDPWIPVVSRDGTQPTLSLADVFSQAPAIAMVGGDDPMEARSIERLLISITWRVCSGRPWREVWEGGLPLEEIRAYLARWRARFDLDRAFQYDVAPSNPTIPDGLDRLVTMDTNRATVPHAVGPDVAARALLRRMLADPSGIRSGIAGDARTTRGKTMPVGPGILTVAPNTLVIHPTLDRTIIWNLPEGPNGGDETPMWEDEADRPRGVYEVSEVGAGRVLVWPGRRLRLTLDADDHAVGAFIANGDQLPSTNIRSADPHALMRLAGTGNLIPREAEWAGEPWTAILPKGATLPVGVRRLLEDPPADLPPTLDVQTLITRFGPQRSRIDDIETQTLTLTTSGLAERARTVESLTGIAEEVSHIIVSARASRRPGAPSDWVQTMHQHITEEQEARTAPTILAYLRGRRLDLKALDRWVEDACRVVERIVGPVPPPRPGFPPAALPNVIRKKWNEARPAAEQ